MTEHELTGRTRHRVGWRQKLILQHEIKGLVTTYGGGMIDSEWRTWWEDSKPEWLTVEKVKS